MSMVDNFIDDKRAPCKNAVKPKTYSKSDMLINTLVSYCKGLHDDRTDKWLREVLDFYSKE